MSIPSSPSSWSIERLPNCTPDLYYPILSNSQNIYTLTSGFMGRRLDGSPARTPIFNRSRVGVYSKPSSSQDGKEDTTDLSICPKLNSEWLHYFVKTRHSS